MGTTDEQIRVQYQPPLTREDLSAAWAYYESHREEIEEAIRENEES
jgi:uncharacterized protein (DUF433 family)